LNKKIKWFDLLACSALTITAAIGIAHSVNNRVDKGSGTISMQNYRQYLKFSAWTSGGKGSSVKMFYDVDVAGRSISYYEISDLELTYKLSAEHAEFSTYSKSIPSILPKNSKNIDSFNAAFTYTGSDQTEWMHDSRDITFELLSISGKYAYSLQGGKL